MLNLVKKARNAVRGERSMEWLKPFMTQRKYRQGEVLCRKGDAANEMFLTVSGKFLVTEFGIELPPGSPVGELGLPSSPARCLPGGQIHTRAGLVDLNRAPIPTPHEPARGVRSLLLWGRLSNGSSVTKKILNWSQTARARSSVFETLQEVVRITSTNRTRKICQIRNRTVASSAFFEPFYLNQQRSRQLRPPLVIGRLPALRHQEAAVSEL